MHLFTQEVWWDVWWINAILMPFHLVKAMFFPVVMYGCESWTIKKAEHQRIDAFELWCWIRLLRVPWMARRSNQSILKEISPEHSLEGLLLKLQYCGWCEELTHWKRPWWWVFSEGKRGKGCQRIRWSDSITDSMNMNLSKLWKIMENRGSWYATILEVTKSWTWLSNWTASCHYVTGCRPSKNVHVFVFQSLSHVQLFVTPWTATRQISLSFTISWSLLQLMSTESVMSSNHLILCHPLLLLPSVFPSIKVFSNDSTLHIRWPCLESSLVLLEMYMRQELNGLGAVQLDSVPCG